MKTKTRTKYGSRWMYCRQGHRHQSTIEAYFCNIYTAMERAGNIDHLQQQPVFELQPKFVSGKGEKVRAIKYVGDFAFRNKKTGKYMVVDVKGVRLPSYLQKVKMLKYIMRDRDDFEFQEVS